MKVIVTGATGMVGEGVLHECLLHPSVEEVLLLSRKTAAVSHPKVREIILSDLMDIAGKENDLSGYDACFFCLGISSIGKSEEEYTRITYDLTMTVAATLLRTNRSMVFCYVSGAGTGNSRQMWARVKQKTENELMLMPFRKVFAFRPGFMNPTKGLKNAHKMYIPFSWSYPLWRLLFPAFVCSLREVGLAMIHAVERGYPKSLLEVVDIVALAGE